MKFIDMHCDTLMHAYLHGYKDIYEMPGMLDISRMKKGGQMAQFFAIFMPPPGIEGKLGLDQPIDDDGYIDTALQIFNASMSMDQGQIAAAYNANDVLRNEKNGKMSGLLTFEDGRPIDGKLENLKKYYELGIRLISLTWNNENCFGYPNSRDSSVMEKGLKVFGRDAISYMNELGIIIDVSHLSDGGFREVADLSKKPFVASHSNSRALCPHPRNLTDEMINMLGQAGGVAGINFGPEFLDANDEVKKSTVELMVKHIDRMVNIGGIESVALGSDLDGIAGDIEVSSPDKMQLLFERLAAKGFNGTMIDKIAYQNALRVMKDTL